MHRQTRIHDSPYVLKNDQEAVLIETILTAFESKQTCKLNRIPKHAKKINKQIKNRVCIIYVSTVSSNKHAHVKRTIIFYKLP